MMKPSCHTVLQGFVFLFLLVDFVSTGIVVMHFEQLSREDAFLDRSTQKRMVEGD